MVQARLITPFSYRGLAVLQRIARQISLSLAATLRAGLIHSAPTPWMAPLSGAHKNVTSATPSGRT